MEQLHQPGLPDESIIPREQSRRAFMRRAAATGAVTAWAAPTVVSLGSTAYAQDQGSPPPDGGGGGQPPATGTILGTVVSATTGNPIGGAAVSGGGVATTTDSIGAYTLAGVPAGTHTVQASAPSYVPASQSVTVTEGGIAIANFALSAADATIRAVLSWGADPDDLDVHVSGPVAGNPSARFHVYYANPTQGDYVELDRDDTMEFGPETTTISIAESGSGAFVPGEYRVWVHNYSNWSNSTRPTFAGSGARVVLFSLTGQIAAFDVSSASGNPADDIWRVVRFTVDAAGNVTGVAAYGDFVPGSNTTVV